MISLNFRLDILSDYHVGSGHGGTLTDSALLRDGDGLPSLRGSTLAGLLRDALWRLLVNAPDGTPLQASRLCRASGLRARSGGPSPETRTYCRGKNRCPVCRVMGSPAAAKRWRITSARPFSSPVPLLDFKAAEQMKDVGAQAIYRARVDPRMRRAAPYKLFSEEEGSALWRFHFKAVCEAEDQTALEEAALLVAAARAVRGFGRSRRRGRGECRIQLEDPAQTKSLLDQFQRVFLLGEAPAAIEEASPQPTSAAVPGLTIQPDTSWIRRRFWIRLEEPLLLASRAEAGNEFETMDELPGTLLWGALAGRAARFRKILPDRKPPNWFAEIFLRDGLRFPALRAARVNAQSFTVTPTIAAPMGLLTCKLSPAFRDDPSHHGIYALGGREAREGRCPQCPETAGTPLRPATGHLTLEDSPKNWSPARRQELHIAVNPVTGRVDEGALYGYTSLDAGQIFFGDLSGSASAWECLRQACKLPDQGEPFALRLGKATTRGHGRVSVLWEDIAENHPAPEPLRAAALRDRVQTDSREIRLTLLSDAIVVDPWGRAYLGFEETWLEHLFQSAGSSVKVKILETAARSRVIDSFAGNIGLPRFRDQALVAGSEVLLEIEGEAPEDLPAILENLERTGIGLRTGEGFGQVVFNHPVYTPEGRKELAERPIQLPQRFRTNSAGACPPLDVEKFRREWSELIQTEIAANNEEAGPFRKKEFAPVARLLWQDANRPVADLIKRLDEFGEPKVLLGNDLDGPRSEKASRKDTMNGRGRVKVLLSKLDDHPGLAGVSPPQAALMRRLVIEELADRVAQEAALDKEKKE